MTFVCAILLACASPSLAMRIPLMKMINMTHDSNDSDFLDHLLSASNDVDVLNATDVDVTDVSNVSVSV